MKHFFLIALGMALLGCGNETNVADTEDKPVVEETAEDHADHDHGETDGDFVAFCGTCGSGVTDTDSHICDPTGKECGKCGMHKGSALCCKLEGDFSDKFLCTSCGHVKGTDSCCSKDNAVCSKCGLHKGAPLCCKLSDKDDHDHSHADEDAEAPAKE